MSIMVGGDSDCVIKSFWCVGSLDYGSAVEEVIICSLFCACQEKCKFGSGSFGQRGHISSLLSDLSKFLVCSFFFFFFGLLLGRPLVDR